MVDRIQINSGMLKIRLSEMELGKFTRIPELTGLRA